VKVTAELVEGVSRSILSQNYEDATEVPDFHKDLWGLCCSDHPRVAMAAPRGHAKSTAITHAYVISCLCMRERQYVLIVSDTEEQSGEFISDIKREFTDNDVLRDLYGVDKLVRDQTTDAIIRFKDGHMCRIIGKGSEQKIRGRKWRGTRPDLIIADDIENEELTLSDLRREKLKKWFYGSVMPAGSSNCVIRVVGTVMHFDSLLNSLMPPEEGSTRTALKDSFEGDWISVLYRAHPAEDDFSEILWPERHPEEKLRLIQRDYVRQGIPEVYASEYLNNPISAENAYFREQDFIAMEDADRAMEWGRYASADLAISEKDRSAYTVIYAGGPDEKRRLQVRDRRKGRWSSDKIIEEIFSVVQRWQVKELFLESENISKAIGPQIEEEMRRRGVYFTIHRMIPSKDKQQRASPLQAMMRAGMVRFDTETDWYTNCRNEMLRFPKGPYRDDVDALAQLASGIQLMVEPHTPEEIEEEEYEEVIYNFGFGRNSFTGY